MIDSLKKYKPPTRYTMNENEFIPFDGPPKDPLEPGVASKSSEGDSNENFDWYSDKMHDSSYFCISNTDRRTLLKGE